MTNAKYLPLLYLTYQRLIQTAVKSMSWLTYDNVDYTMIK